MKRKEGGGGGYIDLHKNIKAVHYTLQFDTHKSGMKFLLFCST